MTVRTIIAVPGIVVDDGQYFIFRFNAAPGSIPPEPWLTTGYLHRPISASTGAPVGSPPLTWAETSDLDTWTETIKYAFRNKTPITIIYDDDITKANNFTTADGNTYNCLALYAVTG